MKKSDKDDDQTVVQETPLFLRDMEALISLNPIEPDELGERCFSLANGRVVFGLLVAELPDSFLVALASTLVSDGRQIEGKLLTAAPVIRLFKSGVSFVSVPEMEHQYLYFRHVRRLLGVMPGFFSPGRLAKIEDVISNWESRQKLNRNSSPTDSAEATSANPGRMVPYDSPTRH